MTMAKKSVRFTSSTHDASVNEVREFDAVVADRLVANGHAVEVASPVKVDAPKSSAK